MKATRTQKLERELLAAEQVLRDRLLHELAHAAEHGGFVFDASRDGERLPDRWVALGDELSEQARSCQGMREMLSLPLEGSVGDLYLRCCAENASGDAHRRGVRRLAAWLLAELRSRD
jgi:hypothetical protein